MLPLCNVRVVFRDRQRSICKRLEALWRNRTASVPLPLARMIHDSSAAIADPLLRHACGQQARPSDPRRTARVRLGSSGLRALVSRRGWAISPRTVMKNAG